MINTLLCIKETELPNCEFKRLAKDFPFRESEEMTFNTLYSLETWVTRLLTFSVKSDFVKDMSCRCFVCSTVQSKRGSDENKLIYFPSYNNRRQLKCNILRNRLHVQRNLERLSLFIYLELRWTYRPQFFIVYKLNDQRNDVNNV